MKGPLTRADIEHAIELSDKHGLTWPVIAERTGRPVGTLKTTVWRFRQGKWGAASRQRARQIEAEAQDLIAAGVTNIAEIARRVGATYAQTYTRLQKIGLDRETIREAAEMARMAA